jgi:hypothetical protein
MDILTEARHLVTGDRQDDYGNAKGNYELMAKMWSPILGFEVSPSQVVMCLIAMKLTREVIKHKRDNLVDLAGYAHILDLVETDDL